MILALADPFPFPLSLKLLDREEILGSSQFQISIDTAIFEGRLRFETVIWILNSDWDSFVSALFEPEFTEAVLTDMSNDFRLRLASNGIDADAGIEVVRRSRQAPDLSLSLRRDKVGYDLTNVVRRTFAECERWWTET